MLSFKLRIVLGFFAVLLTLYPSTSLAKRFPKDPMTLYDYIQLKCSAPCVKADEALLAAEQAAEEFQVDLYVLLAIMRVESAYSVTAKNASNVGLMQINLRYHKPKFQKRSYYDIRDNVRVGAIVYRDCLKRVKGNRTRALQCYNGKADPKYDQKVTRSIKELKALAVLL